MSHPQGYRADDKASVLSYAGRLEGVSLRNSMVREGLQPYLEGGDWSMRRRNQGEGNKGGFGGAVEVGYFGLPGDNEARPDFEEIDLELKTTGLKLLKRGGWTPKERLKITVIDYRDLAEVPFEESRVAKKAKDMLIVFYRFESEVSDPFDYIVHRVVNWGFGSAPARLMEVIRADYEILQQKVLEGKAHEISGGDTQFLEALTSGTGQRQSQPHSPEKPKQRSFALKGALLKLILEDKQARISSVWDPIGQAMGLIRSHIGKTSKAIRDEVAPQLGLKAKSFNANVMGRLFGTKLKAALAAGEIKVVNLRCREDGRPKEAVSFPAFTFQDLKDEADWFTSSCRQQMEMRMLLVVWKSGEDIPSSLLVGAIPWTLPQSDLEGPVKGCWELARQAVLASDGAAFPGSKDNPVAHVRPHGRDKKDADRMPDGTLFTKQSFWLNQGYLQGVVSSAFPQLRAQA